MAAPVSDSVAHATGPVADTVAGVAPLSDTATALAGPTPPVDAFTTPPVPAPFAGEAASLLTSPNPPAGAPPQPPDGSILSNLHAPDVTPELTAAMQILATPDSRLIIGGIIATAIAGSAAGIGMFNFDQVLLQQCGAGIRSVFDTVRLIPCRAAAGLGVSSSSAAMQAPSTTAPQTTAPQTSTSGRGSATPNEPENEPGNAPEPTPQPVSLAGLTVEPAPFRWVAPGVDAVVRWFVALTAALCSVLAAVGAVRHERCYRREAVYRTRFHA